MNDFANNTAVTVTRTLKATPQQVFQAWTDPDRLRQWLIPGPGVVAEAEADVVVGGAYRLVKVTEERVEVMSGEYLVVDPPHRLVFTWTDPHLGPTPTRVTVTLVDGLAAGRPETTTMTIRHERLPDGHFKTSAPLVWGSLVTKLEVLLAGGSVALDDDRDAFLCPGWAGGAPVNEG